MREATVQERSVKIAGNENLDYCISAGHTQIIEAESDWQDPSHLPKCARERRTGIVTHHFLLPAVLMRGICRYGTVSSIVCFLWMG